MGISYYFDNIRLITKEEIDLIEKYYNKFFDKISDKDIEYFLFKRKK
jgi:hypothetical protein